MKTQGFERRFSQNLAPVSQNRTLKPLPRLYFTFIQQAPIICRLKLLILWSVGGWGYWLKRERLIVHQVRSLLFSLICRMISIIWACRSSILSKCR